MEKETGFAKHPFNIFPDMTGEEKKRLRNDIKYFGYDATQPICIYQGKILDGWNRYKICMELGIEPVVKELKCSDKEAFLFVLRTNKRRNLTSSQCAAIAVLANEVREKIYAGVQEEKTKKQKEHAANQYTKKDPPVNKLSKGKKNEHATATHTKVDRAFKTNRTYIDVLNQAQKENPEIINEVLSGKKTVTQVQKEQKNKKREEEKQKKAKQIQESPDAPIIALQDYKTWLPQQPDCDLLLTDPPYSTDVKEIKAFAKEWLTLALDKVKSTGRAYIFIGAYPEELHAYLSVKMPDQVLVWTYKNTLGPTPKDKYKQNWQAILYYKMPDAPPLNCSEMLEQFSVQEINAPDGRHGDRFLQCMKPDVLAERFILHATREGDFVLDPFCGTGTVILAANKYGRKGFGCDNDKHILKIAEERGCKVEGKNEEA